MAATPPPKTPDRHYDFKSMNVVFAISSLAFLAITLFMVLRDYARPWKRVQAEFRDLDRAAATKQLEEERQQIDQTQIAAVAAGDREDAGRSRQRAATRSRRSRRRSPRIARRSFAADARMRATKSSLDAAKYQFDVALRSGDEGEIDGQREDGRRADRALDRASSGRSRSSTPSARRSSSSCASARPRTMRPRSAWPSSTPRSPASQTRLASLEKDLAYFALNAPLDGLPGAHRSRSSR